MLDHLMQYSKTGVQLTERFESCQLTAYRDIRGVLTIGWGHTGSDVFEGQTITQDRADQLLLQDTQMAVMTVNRLVTVPLTQPEFDALVDFIFNVGSGNFASSTLLKLLNYGEYQGAAEQFERWSFAGGQKVAGLLRRRQAEEAEFDQPSGTANA